MATTATSSSTQTILDQYVNAYVATQQYRYEPLDAKASTLDIKQQFYTQLNGKLNSLLSAMDVFGTYKDVTTTNDDGTESTTRKYVKTNNIDDKFVTRKVTTSSSDYVTATAKGTAMTGNNSVKVLQLAQADNYIGKQVSIAKTPAYNDDGTIKTDDKGEEVSVGSLDNVLKANLDAEGKGTLTFKIKVGDDERSISVNYTADSTNEDVMKAIVKQVNMSEDNGGAGDLLNAAFVKDSTGTARLTFTSKTTGSENQLSFSVDEGTDTNVSALNFLGVTTTNERSAYTDGNSDGGFQNADINLLDSKINLNGVTIVRGSNSIDDAIDGVTLTLKQVNKTDDSPTVLTTSIDSDAVKKLIDPLITAFNNLSSLITVNKDQVSDSAMNSLYNTLRSIVSDDISGYAETSAYMNDESVPIKYLAELGFSISSTDGMLTLSDSTKFDNILNGDDGAKRIADAINGFAAKVSEYVDNLSSRENKTGLIKSRLNSINEQIEANNKKIAAVDESINKMAEAQRKQYTAYLSAYYNAQNQSALMSLFSTSNNAYDSLVASQATSNSNSNSSSSSSST